MKFVISLVFFILSYQSLASDLIAVNPIQGDLQIPDNYLETKQKLEKRDQVIPMEANQATSPGAFTGKILEYHFASIISNSQIKPLESLKSIENSVNKNTEVKSKHFNLKSKLDMNRLKAEIDLETFIKAKMWTEDSFKTLRTQMKLYDIQSGLFNNGLLSLENKANNEDTSTYFTFKKTW